MDKKYIEENEIEIKYLRNKLTPNELEEFEVYLMENPEMLEGLGLRDILLMDVMADSKHSSGSLTTASWMGRLFPSMISLPVMASIGFLIGGFVFSSANFISRSSVTEIYATQYIELVNVRSGDEDAVLNTIRIDQKGEAQETKMVALLLDTGAIGSKSWEVEIRKTNISADPVSPVISISTLSNDDGYILLSVPRGSIEHGEYLASLSEPNKKSTKKYSFIVDKR